jgi:hypothetical protein
LAASTRSASDRAGSGSRCSGLLQSLERRLRFLADPVHPFGQIDRRNRFGIESRIAGGLRQRPVQFAGALAQSRGKQQIDRMRVSAGFPDSIRLFEQSVRKRFR